ncbi:DUF6179 domain-containing protein [Peptococcaceae bacterium 1198_IL3148]
MIAAEDIHHLLYGYHEGYGDLLINIFEHVLTAAVGCMFANGSVTKVTLNVIRAIKSCQIDSIFTLLYWPVPMLSTFIRATKLGY